MGFLGGGGPAAPTVTNQASSPYGPMGTLELQNYTDESNAYSQQGLTALEEGQRNAIQQAQQVHMYRENQAAAVGGQGILNQGSPLLNEEFTRSQGQMEVDAILNSAQAQSSLLYQKGLQTMNEGRAALFGQQDGYIANQANNQIQQAMQNGKFWDGILGGVGSLVGGQLGQAGAGLLQGLTGAGGGGFQSLTPEVGGAVDF